LTPKEPKKTRNLSNFVPQSKGKVGDGGKGGKKGKEDAIGQELVGPKRDLCKDPESTGTGLLFQSAQGEEGPRKGFS